MCFLLLICKNTKNKSVPNWNLFHACSSIKCGAFVSSSSLKLILAIFADFGQFSKTLSDLKYSDLYQMATKCEINMSIYQ